MSGALNFVFGGPSKSKATSTPRDMQAPEFQALRNPFANALATLLQGGAGQFNPSPEFTGFDPNALVAPMAAGERTALADVNAMALDPARRALIQSTLQGNFLPGQSEGNPFLAAAIEMAQRPTMEALQHAVGRQIPGMFAQAGHQVGSTIGSGSTAKDLNVLRASEIGARALGDIATGISFQAFDSERNRQQQAIALGGQEVETAVKNLAAQSLPRLLEDLGIERAVKVGQDTRNQWLQVVALLGGITAPAIANQAQSTATGAQKGIFEQLFPKGLQAG